MIPPIDILIILSGISAAQASPMRRYANTTSQVIDAMTGVVYRPYDGNPSLSLAPVQGITTLPFSELLETPASAADVPNTALPRFGTKSTAIATGAASFQYQPLESSSIQNAEVSSSTHNSHNDGIPTSFRTFGNQDVGTVYVTSTTYETVWAPPQATESSSPQESRTTQAQNTTANSSYQPSRTFVWDPLTTSSSYGAAATTESAASMAASDAYPLPVPFATTVPAASPSQQSDDSDSTFGSSSSSAKLPKVVTEGSPTTGSETEATASDTTAVPGITIVPQNPSVIYITMTDAGATTTVTA